MEPEHLVENAKVLMNFDYAWPITELVSNGVEKRFQGSVCRLLYLLSKLLITSSDACQNTLNVHIVPTTSPPIEHFDSEIAESCALLGVSIVQDPSEANATFCYLGCNASSTDVEKVVKSTMLSQSNTPPIVVMLLGDCEALGATTCPEEERVRGLSAFRLNQEINEVLDKSYSVWGHFAVEFLLAAATEHDTAKTSRTLRSVGLGSAEMSDMLHRVEKWQLYAPTCLNMSQAFTELSEVEHSRWEELSNGVVCNECGVLASDGNFKVCSRCQEASYCSRECQKKAWKSHKRQCCPK